MKQERNSFIISPLDKGFQIDSVDELGKPIKWGSSNKKNAINSAVNKIPKKHQIIIIDMGEIK